MGWRSQVQDYLKSLGYRGGLGWLHVLKKNFLARTQEFHASMSLFFGRSTESEGRCRAATPTLFLL